MRRLTRCIRDETGASAVLVALLMVVVVGFVGLAVDVGGMYWENGQLQDGADAGASAVARSCAMTPTTCSTTMPIAGTFANQNANDARSDAAIAFKNGTPTSGEVTVTTSTRQAGGSPYVFHQFWDAMAGLMGVPVQSTTEHASATARWGAPTSSTVAIPLTISICSFTPALDGTKTLIQYANPNSRTTCAGNSGYPSGGFGWLNQTNCYATITNGTVLGDPGNSYPTTCDSTFQQSLVGQTIIVPIFNDYTPAHGQNGQISYNISGFAAFVITGWKFSGGSNYPQVHADPTLVGTSNDCTGSCRGIQGYFTKWVSSDAVGVTIGTPGSCPLGDCIVRLVP